MLEDYKDLLLEKNVIAHIAITRTNGTPHVSPVWFDMSVNDFPKLEFTFNSAKGRVKTNNLKIGSIVSLSILDPDDPYRYVGITGKIINIVEGKEAENHIHELSRRYMGKDFAIKQGQIRIKYRIKITNIYLY